MFLQIPIISIIIIKIVIVVVQVARFFSLLSHFNHNCSLPPFYRNILTIYSSGRCGNFIDKTMYTNEYQIHIKDVYK